MLISDYMAQEAAAWSNTKMLTTYLTTTWRNLLKAGPRTKHEALSWLAECLKSNMVSKYNPAVCPLYLYSLFVCF